MVLTIFMYLLIIIHSGIFLAHFKVELWTCYWKFWTYRFVYKICQVICIVDLWTLRVWTACCCCSIIQSCLTLCDLMDYSTPGLSVPHHLPKFAQVYVHWTAWSTEMWIFFSSKHCSTTWSVGWLEASLTQWTWFWANSGKWWGTGKSGVLQSMGSQSIGHDWVTEVQHGL